MTTKVIESDLHEITFSGIQYYTILHVNPLLEDKVNYLIEFFYAKHRVLYRTVLYEQIFDFCEANNIVSAIFDVSGSIHCYVTSLNDLILIKLGLNEYTSAVAKIKIEI